MDFAPLNSPPVKPIATPHTRWLNALILLGKCALGVLLVLWLVRSGQLDLGLLARAKIGWSLTGVFLSQMAMIGCQAVRWHLLARAQALPFTPAQTLALSLRGQFAGVWTPSNLGLDGVRWLYATRLFPGRSQAALVTLVVDRVLGVLTLFFFVSFPLVFLTPRAELQPLFGMARWIVVVAVAMAALGVLGWKRSRTRMQSLLASDGFLGRILAMLNAFGTQPKVLWSACAWAGLTHFSNALSFWFGFQALGIQADLLIVLMVAPIVILSFIVPLTPLGLGVADAVAATLFGTVGIVGGGATTMLLRVTWLLLSLVCGLAFFYRDAGTTDGFEADSLNPGATNGAEKVGIGGNGIGRD